MKLFKESTFENQDFKDILDLIKKVVIIDGDFKFSKVVTYREFKDKICKFIKSVMKIFLQDTEYKDNKCITDILEKLYGNKGLFLDCGTKNIIIINDSIIKEIYNGRFDKFLIILHELNHFNVKYSIMLGEVNEDIVRIIKERLIRFSSNDPLEKGVPNEYYDFNYRLFSEEIYVDMCAREDLILILTMLTNDIEFKEEIKKMFLEEFSKEIEKDKERYNNHLRNLTTNLNFNDMYLDFEEAFEHLIQDNHEWLDIPQIAIEYCLDNGIVRKRNTKELEELLKTSTNIQEQKYIKVLIDKSKESNRTLN